VRDDACIADWRGGLVCGEGKGALRVLADTTSPSRNDAFPWLTAQGRRPATIFPTMSKMSRSVSPTAVLATAGEGPVPTPYTRRTAPPSTGIAAPLI
jgi:hypothetical protein